MIERVSGAVDFEEIKWMLQEPIINFTQSVVDDAIKANVDFHSDAGLNPTIKRTAVGKGLRLVQKRGRNIQIWQRAERHLQTS